MNTKIKFGTDGFRGIMGENFNEKTVQKITLAIAEYLRKGTVLIGYDPRLNADKYARLSADILTQYGFDVLLSTRVVPTPILAYSALHVKNSQGAIMFTASHNPKEYLGIKFIPNYGGPATSDITKKIEEIIENETLTIKEAEGSLVKKDFSFLYYMGVEKLIDFKKIQQNPKKIIYDGLFSASVGHFDVLLQNKGIRFEAFNDKYDPDFGGFLPEPKKEFMRNYKKGYITLANDGDADRYGVVDEEGIWTSPNIIMAILLKYLKEKGKKGAVVKTVGVSQIIDVVAKKLNVPVIETPVGFKWIGEVMRKTKVILGGEDSGGLSIGGHISEKDGILANLLIMEMLSSTNKTLAQLKREIIEFSGVFFHQDRIDIKLDDNSKKDEIIAKIKMEENFALQKIEAKTEIDGVKLHLSDKTSKILVRKSGTEPLLRFYIETDSITKMNSIKEFIRGYMYVAN